VSLAAFLLFGLIRDKPFGTANTQTALALMLAFLVRNGAVVDAPDEELAGVCIGVAQGEVYAGMVEMWLRDCARPLYR
jgi:prophage maintenance system killer protein